MQTIWVGEENVQQPEPWAIRGALGGLTVLWAPYASYKTFLAISMAVAVASGRPWFGRPVRQGPVLYIVGEGGTELFKRRLSAAAAESALSLKDLPIWITTAPADLSTPLKLEPYYPQWDTVSPVLIVVDTVSRALVGDENKQEAMQAFVASLDALRARYGASVLAVHHANRAGQIRGSNVLPSAADVVLRITRGSTERGVRRSILLRADKLKDLDTEDFYPNILYPQIVNVKTDVGSTMVDEVGDLVTTIVMREDAGVLDREKDALAVLTRLAAARPPTQAVGYKEWYEEAAKGGMSRSTFARAARGLLAADKVSQAKNGHYFVGKVSPLTEWEDYELGENYNTDEELQAELEAAIKEREEEEEWRQGQ